MKSNMCLKVEFLAGTSIEAAVFEASEKARVLGLAYVKFDFNGISMSIKGDADIDKAVKSFNEVLSSGKKHKFVVC